jgi:hypothetical protein
MLGEPDVAQHAPSAGLAELHPPVVEVGDRKRPSVWARAQPLACRRILECVTVITTAAAAATILSICMLPVAAKPAGHHRAAAGVQQQYAVRPVTARGVVRLYTDLRTYTDRHARPGACYEPRRSYGYTPPPPPHTHTLPTAAQVASHS